MEAMKLLSLVAATSGLLLAGTTTNNGAQLFEQHCSACHGANGSGGTGPSLRVPLRRGRTVPAITSVIKNGIPDTIMPASGLSDELNTQIAQYVTMLQKRRPGKTRNRQ